jgi:hypothetical protein
VRRRDARTGCWGGSPGFKWWQATGCTVRPAMGLSSGGRVSSPPRAPYWNAAIEAGGGNERASDSPGTPKSLLNNDLRKSLK